MRALQPLHQVEHLGPDRHVERADRLVGHDHLRVQGQGAGESDALALPAGELVREPLDRVARQADLAEQLEDPVFLLLAAADALDRQRLPDDRADPHPAGRARSTGPGTSAAGHAAACAARCPCSLEMSVPCSVTSPEVGRSSATIMRPIVVLPQPDSPTRPNVSPAATENETPETALHRADRALQDARGHREFLDQVLDLEQRGAFGAGRWRPGPRPDRDRVRGHRPSSTTTSTPAAACAALAARAAASISSGSQRAVDRVPARVQVAGRSRRSATARRSGTCRWPCCTGRRTGSPPAGGRGRAAGRGCSAAAGCGPGSAAGSRRAAPECTGGACGRRGWRSLSSRPAGPRTSR